MHFSCIKWLKKKKIYKKKPRCLQANEASGTRLPGCIISGDYRNRRISSQAIRDQNVNCAFELIALLVDVYVKWSSVFNLYGALWLGSSVELVCETVGYRATCMCATAVWRHFHPSTCIHQHTSLYFTACRLLWITPALAGTTLHSSSSIALATRWQVKVYDTTNAHTGPNSLIIRFSSTRQHGFSAG